MRALSLKVSVEECKKLWFDENLSIEEAAFFSQLSGWGLSQVAKKEGWPHPKPYKDRGKRFADPTPEEIKERAAAIKERNLVIKKDSRLTDRGFDYQPPTRVYRCINSNSPRGIYFDSYET
jgi:hypothetical protein